jgi:hypothetical protein
MKTPLHRPSNPSSKKDQTQRDPAPEIALTSEIARLPSIKVPIEIKLPSQDQTGHLDSPRTSRPPTIHYEEGKAQKDISSLIHNIVKSNLKLWGQNKTLYYEYVVGSLHKHNIIERNQVVAFEKNRHSASAQDANIMGSIYPIYFDRKDDYKIQLFKADLELFKKEEQLDHIESIIDIYRDVINSHKKFMSQPDVPRLELPETAPVLWEDAPKREKPIEFINRVYGDYIIQGLMTQGDLRHLDYKLYRAFHNWCDRKGIDPKTIVPPGRRRTEKILDQFDDLTYENSLGLVFKTAHTQDSVPSDLVLRGEAFFSLLRRRKINMKRSPT